MSQTSSRSLHGVSYAVASYLIWGFFPLYFLLTPPASALEVVALRVLFSLIFCLALIPLSGQLGQLITSLRRPKDLGLLLLASLLIFANWLLFVIATTSSRVMEASLGYYVTPLVSVGLGLLFLKEKISRLQVLGLAAGALAVFVMLRFYGSVPWLGLGLAATFGLYGLIKKKLGALPALTSLTLETLLLTPLAACLLMIFLGQGQLTLLQEGPAHFWILAVSGPLTALPLLFFAAGASRIQLSSMGMIQYLGPTLQFLLALWVTREETSPGRWAAFGLVWLAAIFFSADALKKRRASSRPAGS